MPQRGFRATHCVHGHAFSGDNVFISQGKQRCRECHRAAELKYRAARRIPPPPRPTECAVETCTKPPRGRKDWCDQHYRRVRKYGDALVAQRYRGDPLMRFWTKVEKSDGCWIWTGARRPRGYGQIYWNGRVQAAHRVSLELAGRPVPIGYDTDHLCRNPQCVRPDHLEAVTHVENVRRGDAGRYQRRAA